jgi:hypothetical protein
MEEAAANGGVSCAHSQDIRLTAKRCGALLLMAWRSGAIRPLWLEFRDLLIIVTPRAKHWIMPEESSRSDLVDRWHQGLVEVPFQKIEYGT